MDGLKMLALWFTAGTTLIGAALGFTIGALLAALATWLFTGAPDAIAILTTGGVLALIGSLPGVGVTALFLLSPNK
jgi:hypothetical protein